MEDKNVVPSLFVLTFSFYPLVSGRHGCPGDHNDAGRGQFYRKADAAKEGEQNHRHAFRPARRNNDDSNERQSISQTYNFTKWLLGKRYTKPKYPEKSLQMCENMNFWKGEFLRSVL